MWLVFLVYSTRCSVGFSEGGGLNARWVAKGTNGMMDCQNGARNPSVYIVNARAGVACGLSFLLHSTRC